MQIRDVLRTQYTRLDASDTLPDICRIFSERHIASAPVQKNDQFVGVVSDSDIIGAIAKNRLSDVWEKDRPTPAPALAGITAGQLAKKPKSILSPDDKLSSAISKISKKDIDLVPVVEEGRLVGIIRGTDIMHFLLREFAKHELSSPASPAHAENNAPDLDSENVGTIVDSLLALISQRKKITIAQLCRETRLPRDQLEKIAKSLESHHLIEIDYPLLGEMTLKVLYHE